MGFKKNIPPEIYVPYVFHICSIYIPYMFHIYYVYLYVFFLKSQKWLVKPEKSETSHVSKWRASMACFAAEPTAPPLAGRGKTGRDWWMCLTSKNWGIWLDLHGIHMGFTWIFMEFTWIFMEFMGFTMEIRADYVGYVGLLVYITSKIIRVYARSIYC